MRTPIKLYDKKGIPIQVGDMLKVFHFKTNRNHWMYKQVFMRDGFLGAKHYPFDKNDGYDLQCMADSRGVLLNHEVIDEDLKLIRGKPMICFYERLDRIKIEKLMLACDLAADEDKSTYVVMGRDGKALYKLEPYNKRSKI